MNKKSLYAAFFVIVSGNMIVSNQNKIRTKAEQQEIRDLSYTLFTHEYMGKLTAALRI